MSHAYLLVRAANGLGMGTQIRLVSLKLMVVYTAQDFEVLLQRGKNREDEFKHQEVRMPTGDTTNTKEFGDLFG